MDCEAIHPLLDLHAGGDLDAREAARVDAHLRGCLACYREWNELQSLLATVRGTARRELRSEAMGESIVAGVMRAIDGPPPPAIRWLPRLTLASGWAAAVVLAVTLGWNVLRPAAPRPERAAPPIYESPSLDPSLIRTIGDELGRQFDELPNGLPNGAPNGRTLMPPARRPRALRNF
ncbi:MAG: zf-HC2 domain-containing protein [Planctomycetes bacterium]|nr:zf-HC2 domain-containing protein [Planctomycetota bacterium]